MQAWIKKVQHESDKPAQLRMLPDSGMVAVVGESHYQTELQTIAGEKRPDGVDIAVVATLKKEPSNPYDSNAVRVEISGRLVGYLPRQIAPSYHGVLSSIEESGLTAGCRGFIRGGWKRSGDDEGMFGVVLELASPELCE